MLVDQLANRLEVGCTPGNVGLADSKHVDGGLVQLDEDTVVDLPQTEQLEDLLDLGRDLVDTTDSHHEGKLGVGRDIVVTLFPGFTPQPDLVSLLVLVFLGILLSPLEDGSAFVLPGNLELNSLLCPVSPVLSLPFTALENSFRDSWELCVRHDFSCRSESSSIKLVVLDSPLLC